jgi:hypothetical protein
MTSISRGSWKLPRQAYSLTLPTSNANTKKKSKDKVASGRIAKKATTKSASKKATKATTVYSVAGPASLLHLASNGVPAIRISGATPEESALNADLQPVAILHPEGTLITFDITNGEITGVRSGGELYAREAGIESLAGTETWPDEHERRTCVEGLLGFGKY